MIKSIYTLLLTLLSPILLTVLLKRKKGNPKIGRRWKEYFGFSTKRIAQKPIWIHCSSVGETIAATPLIRVIKDKYPQ
ncbi:glycosyltransferase N-terminal domain-containing protein, partial [Vibrio breoganii]